MSNNEQEWVSKTQMKKQMDSLQDLGMQLTKLSADTLKKIGLSEDLYEAVVTYKKITSNGALKRQAQYIGRLMRDTDPEPIERYLAKLRGDNAAHNAFLQRVEQARDRLIASDDALTAFIADYPHADAGKLRTLIRNTRKEQESNKPPKNFRALFQEIKAVMDGGHTDTDDGEQEEDFE
ncbi:MAG: ribosome biogenesis factor YjgA [Neisseria zoodegmatis]|uniref:ribosome biogenesis factor YjgA n=1 Tax=Neisseria zoodegmatis TaxID=326523 RepID=UPI0026EA1EC0|nr:ribosome biogenesis factor YjgA [Neisseria zoodegmatis]MDO5070810.1 ribosome biogenesis factor YjgA [Neisseria zoodegmatis]